MIVVRHIAELDLPRHGAVGLVPTMGALHAGHAALFAAARPACDVLVASLFVNPAQFSDAGDLAPTRATSRRTRRARRPAAVDVLFAPPADELYPPGFATWVEPAGRGRGPRGRAPPGPLPRRRDRLPEAVQHRPPAGGVVRAQGRAAGRGAEAARPRPQPRARDPRRRDGARRRRPRALLAQRAPDAAERAQALAIPRALATRDPDAGRARLLAAAGIEPDYVAVADLDGPTLAVAARVGRTRLIDNVLLKGAS